MNKFCSFTLLLACSLTLLITSCNSKKIELVDPSAELLDSISLVSMKEIGDTTAQSDLIIPASKGLQWKAWEAWFKNCPQSATFKKNIVYLGAASSKRVGYILSKDVSMNKWDFFKIINKDDQVQSFIDTGVIVDQCDLKLMKDFSLDMIIGGNFLNSLNASLGAVIGSAQNINVIAGSWKIESIDAGPFMDFVNNHPSPNFVKYREALLNKDNIVLTKVLKISGFKAIITSRDTLGAKLSAELKNGLKVDVVPVDTTKKIGFSLNFQKSSNKTITISSTGQFSLFGQASKGKELK